MAEYISREAVNNIIDDMRNNHFILMSERINLVLLKSKIAEIPAADVQPVDRWISVDDRLPKEIGYYLVIIGNDMLYSIDIAEYSKNRWHKHDRVIYWQDLPDYPKSINGNE